MIQLRRVQLHNFRLLRDIEIDFSIDPERPLTVIRAENDTGKTTLLNALNWGIFGDSALPGVKSAYRLHPIDWRATETTTEVEIRVVIDFAVIDEETGGDTVYQLARSAVERLSGVKDFDRSPSTLTLLKESTAGSLPVENPTATLANLVPKSLRDIFFIDGDRALAFIEATDEQRVKRERVAGAVRSLLGLDLLEDAERHVDGARREAVASIKKLGAGTEVEDLATKRQSLEERLTGAREAQIQEQNDSVATEARHRQADQKLKEALATGAGEHRRIGHELSSSEASLQKEREAQRSFVAAHRRALNTPSLTLALAPSVLLKAGQILGELEDRKVIPNTLPGVIEDVLMAGQCICGCDLPAGSPRRRHLEDALKSTQGLDESKELLRGLNESAKRLAREGGATAGAAEKLRDAVAAVRQSQKRINDLETSVGELRARIRGLQETDLVQLEDTVQREDRERKRLQNLLGQREQLIKSLENQLADIDRLRKAAQHKVGQVLAGSAREAAALDLLHVIRATMDVLQGQTLDEVSEKMNQIFLAMIVADHDAGSVIRNVKLTRDHDIVVTASGGHHLDPDNDLNGASRRALTLAFILALVQVSGVRAPNVIDTPLGMMGVEVRRSVVSYAAGSASQLILFLTGSEILGVEDLLDQFVGVGYTFTNTAHYPSKIVNDPGTGRIETLKCDCSHRESCDRCKRLVSSAAFEMAGI